MKILLLSWALVIFGDDADVAQAQQQAQSIERPGARAPIRQDSYPRLDNGVTIGRRYPGSFPYPPIVINPYPNYPPYYPDYGPWEEEAETETSSTTTSTTRAPTTSTLRMTPQVVMVHSGITQRPRQSCVPWLQDCEGSGDCCWGKCKVTFLGRKLCKLI